MTGWIVECTESDLEEFVADGLVVHDAEFEISSGDSVYLRDVDSETLVGEFSAVSDSFEDGQGRHQTYIDIDGDGPLSVETAEFPFELSEGALRSRRNTDVGMTFDYEGERIKFGKETDEEQSQDTSEGVDSPPQGVPLSEVLTSEYDVEDRDFSGQDVARNQVVGDLTLRGCDFSEADLQGITFKGTDLRDTDFREANLKDATFDSDVKIQGADFTKAQMNQVTVEADVTASDFTLAVLNDGDLRNAALEGADFSDAYLRRVDFRGTLPKRANFQRAILRGIQTSGAEFERTSFVDADLSRVDFKDAKLEDCDFSDAQLTNTNFSGAGMFVNDFIDAHMQGADFSGTNVDGHDFRGADLRGSKFPGSAAEGSSFQDAVLTDGNFSKAHLVGARFVGAKADQSTFDEAELTGATFADADLFGSSFTDAALYGVHLASARVDSTDPFDERCIYERNYEEIFGDDERQSDTRTSDAISTHDKAASVYRTLEAVMDRNSQTSAALEYAFRRKEAVRRVHKEKGETKSFAISSVSRYLVSHGTNFGLLFLWTGLIVVGAGAFYVAGDYLYHGDQLLQLGADGYSNGAVIALALLFSAYSFTGLGFGEFQPVGIGKLLSVTETGFGILFFALFVYVFTTRASR